MRSPFGLLLRRATLERYGLPETGLGSESSRLSVFRTIVSAANQGRTHDLAPTLSASTLESCALMIDMLRVAAEHDDDVTRAAARLDAGELDAIRAAIERNYTTRPLKPDEALQEMVGLLVLTDNPALSAYRALLDDAPLTGAVPNHRQLSARALADLDGTTFGGALEVLRASMASSPMSLGAQLEALTAHLRALLPEALLLATTNLEAVRREEHVFRGPPGPAPAEVFEPRAVDLEAIEAFTEDRDWMSNVILIAKSTHVWLHQLSARFGRTIATLDQVPDEELDALAASGFTGLWLIGLWRRSKASQTIKQRMGNPDALASAYALEDYVIADGLGGADAFEDLKARLEQRGMRLAVDMVPNHTGLTSTWLAEHPEWFVQLDAPPYPSYTFDGPNLSSDPRMEIYLEDGYWNQTDAAVVFLRVDPATGHRRYIYHGNDGTQMPWNDTAQLDYLNPEVREAVTEVIMRVARMSPIIRFDAAMTLAQRHVQRLWHPTPEQAGAIPSRAEHGADPATFAAQMPTEFWRDVVDRVQEELPDTLLLAEAFWFMEAYFVRSLGMHRVYNSAFMHMLKNEENAKYRASIKNVLAFSPEVLKRYVNFMNNPDEETAAVQFGRGDKYFGVTTLMITLPGLPMFGHGQVEGYAEKYGMEYAAPQWNESVDAGLVEHHQRVIFPLLRARHLFSEAERFELYDVIDEHGHVVEDIYAFSNRAGQERSLVFYNNCAAHRAGAIETSAPVQRGDAATLTRRGWREALELEPGALYSALNPTTGLRYLVRATNALPIALDGYGTRVLVAWRAIDTSDHPEAWASFTEELGSAGVRDVALAFEAFRARPDRQALEASVEALMAEPRLPLHSRVAAHLTAADHALIEANVDARVTRCAEAMVAVDLDTHDVKSLTAAAAVLALAQALEPSSAFSDHAWAGWLDGVTDETLAEATDVVRRHPGEPLARLIDQSATFLRLNTSDGIDWFHKESMETLAVAWSLSHDDGPTLEAILGCVDASSYKRARFEALLQALETPTAPADRTGGSR